MESEKVYLNLSASEKLNQLRPEDSKAVLRALSLLRDDAYRSNNKYDLYFDDEFNKKITWGLMAGRVFMSFIELEDERVMVTHWSLISRFRVPHRPQWPEIE